MRKWRWIILSGSGVNTLKKEALVWNPQGTGTRERPKQYWKKAVLEEAGKCDNIVE